MKSKICWIVFLGILLSFFKSVAQENILINAGMIDGVELNKQNVLSFQILSTLNYPINADVQGSIVFKNSNMRMSYTLVLRLNPGVNEVSSSGLNVNWAFSSNGLKELFQDYNTLPSGTYQYCIKVIPRNVLGEHEVGNSTEVCMYNKKDELFLINLIDPENNAKLREKNPMLTWVSNYSFSSDLSFSIRVCEVKKGQNAMVAVARNNPQYTEKGLKQNSLLYPVTARELKINQPYAWTVSAYYKDILLGGAEPWIFTIVEDTLQESIPRVIDYVDVRHERGEVRLWAIGVFKLKYELEESRSDSLYFELKDQNGKMVKLKEEKLKINYGDNRIDLDLTVINNMKHRGKYQLSILNTKGMKYTLPFTYINPDLLK